MSRLAELMRQPPKYRARATSCGVHVHASKKEAARCGELRLLERAGEICSLEYQPRYDLQVNGTKVCRYIGDFRYRERLPIKAEGWGGYSDIIVEDCKGFKTPAYKLKRKLMLACYGIEIRET